MFLIFFELLIAFFEITIFDAEPILKKLHFRQLSFIFVGRR